MTITQSRSTDIQGDARAYAHLRDAHPDLPDFVWRIILGFTPRVPAAQWEAVREFTLNTAVAVHPKTYDSARRLMSVSARFHAWLWATAGTTMTADDVYTQNNIDLYVQNRLGARSETHQWQIVRQLVANGRTLTDNELRNLPTPDMQLRAPFTAAHIATMHGWANSLTTTLKKQNAWGLLGLAGGAGLRAEEIVDVNVGDIAVENGRVFVTVTGARARRVPVRHAWARVLLRSIEHRADAERVFRGPHIEEYRPRIIQTFLSDHPARVRPTVCRLRATWIVHHIDNGAPIHALKVLGGFRTYDTLTRYFDMARPLDLNSYTGLFIGEEVVR